MLLLHIQIYNYVYKSNVDRHVNNNHVHKDTTSREDTVRDAALTSLCLYAAPENF